jgi:uncharacterized membrane protein YgcG
MTIKTLKTTLTRGAASALACVLSITVAGLCTVQAAAFQDPQAQNGPVYASQDGAPPPDQTEPASAPQSSPTSAQLTPQQLQQLVAPIALYPDALVAQILAASAYPTQIVEAERFLQQNPNLKGKDLGTAVDQQPWDPSVKALTQFPSVLANMDKNLSWTSELGDANANQANDVMDAVQYMRHKAQTAGHLSSNQQQVVTDDGPNVQIQPADPQVVYVPVYNPDYAYGYPIGYWPGFYPWWGPGPYFAWGLGFGIGWGFGFGWGWGGWGFDWGHRGILYGGGRYGYHSRAFYNRSAYFHNNGGAYRGASGFRGGAPYARGEAGARGYARGGNAGRPGAFGGVQRGGDTRGFSSRGQSSFGGGGFHGGGGGGSHGGGGRH